MKNQIILLLSILLIGNCSPLCRACVGTVQALQTTLIFLAPNFIAKDIVQSLCQRQYDSLDLCKQVAREMTPLALKAGVKGILKQGILCKKICHKSYYNPINIEKELTAISNGNAFFTDHTISNLPIKYFNLTINSKDSIKILHLTDIHLDLNYTQKSSIACDYPICCHKEDGFPQNQANQAKPYGSVKCDTPLKLLESGLDHIAKLNADVDAVIITGDYSAHNEWQKSSKTVHEVRELVEDKVRQKLKVKLLITSPGNNQYLPDHQVDPSSVEQDAVAVYKIYNEFKQATSTFISINTLYCDLMNLYLIEDQTWSIRQLKTIQTILSQNENVYIIGHINPSSRSCSNTYSTLFRAILAKYSKTIKGQFYGHNHVDQFMVNTHPTNHQTTSFSLLAGSFSPLSTDISRYRIYHISRYRIYQFTNQFILYNYKDYYFSVVGEEWKMSYDFKLFYGINFQREINAELIKEFQDRVKNDPVTRNKYDSKASASPAGETYYCFTYDDKNAVDLCKGTVSSSFKGKVTTILQMLQGVWGCYGEKAITKQ